MTAIGPAGDVEGEALTAEPAVTAFSAIRATCNEGKRPFLHKRRLIMSNGQPPRPLDCGPPEEYTEPVKTIGSAPDLPRARWQAEQIVRNVAFSKAVDKLAGRKCPTQCPLLTFTITIGPPKNEKIADVVGPTGPAKSVSFDWEWNLKIGCAELPPSLEPGDVEITDTENLTCIGDVSASGTVSESETEATRAEAIEQAQRAALVEATFAAQKALQMINCPPECPKKEVEFRVATAATLISWSLAWTWPLSFRLLWNCQVFLNWWATFSCKK